MTPEQYKEISPSKKLDSMLYLDYSILKKISPLLPIPTRCNCCGSNDVRLIENLEIYGKSFGKWPYAYYCFGESGCAAYVGLHPYTIAPLGTLADGSTRDKRKEAKNLFHDRMERLERTRTESYKELAEVMNMEKVDCHFALFDYNTCERVIKELTKLENKTLVDYFKDLTNKFMK